MLTALHIQDFVLIEQAHLPLSAGLTALTGETGAGKSILLDAMGLAVGGRAERGAVRQGAVQGAVSVTFEPASDHAVWALLEANGLVTSDDQVILRRVQLPNGKTRAFVNDQPVSVQLLRAVGDSLLEMHGQHDGRGLLTASTHRTLLDEFAGLEADVRATAEVFRRWRAAEAAIEDRRRLRETAAGEADYLRFIVGELEALNAQAGEEETLAARRQALMASEKAREDVAAAVLGLNDQTVEDTLSHAARRLTRAAAAFSENHPLAAAIAHVECAISEIMEARAVLEATADSFDVDAGEQDAVEERLHALRAAARKHGTRPDDLPACLEKARTALSAVDETQSSLAALEAQARRAQSEYRAGAEALSARRSVAAKRLDEAVAKELAPLKLGRAVFTTRVRQNPEHPFSEGTDEVEFMIATNPGAPAGPLKTIASGGELSRFVLAMKAALAAQESRTVIIFDEIDAGVGGAVADAVGERLARLARDAQVLVITHSPQVAARADWHWRVDKVQSKTSTKTLVTPLDDEGRVEEIARMLSGAEISAEARAAARRLLDGGPAPAPGRRRKSA